MTLTNETVKRIVFVGVVFMTLVLFIISCVHCIVSGDKVASDDLADVIADQNSENASEYLSEVDDLLSDEQDFSEESNSELSSEDTESSEDEGYMAGAVYEKLSGVYIESPYCFVYNQTDNVILYEKNAYEKCYPASVTKLLTAAIAMEYVPLDAVFTVGEEINRVGYNSSMAYISIGERYTLKDLIYALLLPSGNDAAYTIAVNTSRYLYGDSLTDDEAVEKFMKLCNDKLLKIGAYNTHFSGPDGYHDDDHYTTAYDMMLISLYSTTFDEISTACATYEYYCKSVDGVAKGWRNSNPLLKKYGEYYCELVTGLKTGATDEAGKCLATTAEKDGKKLYIIILGSSTVEIRNNDTLEIIHSVLGY